MNNFYEKKRLYQSNIGISDCFYDLIPKRATLRKNINSKVFERQVNDFHETSFYEVNVIPYSEIEFSRVGDFLNLDIQIKCVDAKTFSYIMFNALCDIIAKHWDSQKFHVILHSSGYDSRFISLAIRKLYKEKGNDWLGKILFVEAGGEAELFKQIMEYEGWDKSQYVICYKDDCSNPLEYFSDCFDFETAYIKMNGVTSYPVNIWWDTINWLQKKKIIPDDNNIQCWTGYCLNEITDAIGGYKNWDLKKYFKWIYYNQLSTFPLKGNWVYPFYDFDFIKLFIKYGKQYAEEFVRSGCVEPGIGIGIAKLIVDCIEPEIQNIPRLSLNEMYKNDYRKISDKLMDKIMFDCTNSWYYKNVNSSINPTNVIFYSEWWGIWCLMSLCEYLINNGHDINIK